MGNVENISDEKMKLSDLNYKKNTKSESKLIKQDYLVIQDLNLDEKIFIIDDEFNKLRQSLPNNSDKLLKEINKEKINILNHKKPEKYNTIGPVSTLEHIVEKAYQYDRSKINLIITKIEELKSIIFRWRKIKGDGNCFYRAVIFAFLENILFEKNVYLLKFICLEVHKKLNRNNPLLNCLPSNLKDVYCKVDDNFFDITYIICQIIESINNKNEIKCTKKAYEILFQSLIQFDEFDMTLVKFLRYKIYEYISQNEDKIHSKEFNFKLREFLPKEFIINDKYYFDKYYENDLLKLYKDAELITIYIIPYLLKVDVSIIPYDFENTKNNQSLFNCFLPKKNKITLLLKSNHYDLIYSKEYFDKYSKYLTDYYSNFENDKSIISTEVLLSIEQTEQFTRHTAFIDKSKIVETEKISLSLNNNYQNHNLIKNISEKSTIDSCEGLNEQAKIIRDNILNGLRKQNINYEIYKKASKNIKTNFLPMKKLIEKVNFKCLKCKKLSICFTIFNKCKLCLEEEFNLIMLRRYKYFFSFSLYTIINNIDRDSSEILKKKFFTEIPIEFETINIELRLIPFIFGKAILKYYYDFKEEMCLICFNKINKDFKYKLMCGCSLCSTKCILKYLICIFDPFYTKLSKEIICICLYKFKVKSLLEALNSLLSLNIEEFLIDYFMMIFNEFEKNIYQEHCFRCYKKIKQDEEIKERKFRNNNQMHLECKDCIDSEINLNFCEMCEIIHI